MQNHKVLVTGGAGFVGSHLSNKLLDLGYNVHILDNLSTGLPQNIPQKAIFHNIDIRNRIAIENLFAAEKFPIIFHNAAQMSVIRSVKRPVMDADINIIGTLNILDIGLVNGLQKIVFASSGGVIYGNPNKAPQDEDHPLNPISPYGLSKLSCERYLEYYWTNHGISHIALRYANVYGPRQSSKSGAGVIGIFMEKILKGEQPTIYGRGNKTRDFIFVSDIVNANIAALNYHGVGAFNIGTGIETNVNTIFRLIKKHLNLSIPEIHIGEEAGEQLRSVLDITKAQKHLHWSPQISFSDGLKQTIDWYMSTAT